MDPDILPTMESSDVPPESAGSLEASNFGTENVETPDNEMEFPVDSEAVVEGNVANDDDVNQQLDEGEPEEEKEGVKMCYFVILNYKLCHKVNSYIMSSPIISVFQTPSMIIKRAWITKRLRVSFICINFKLFFQSKT